MARILVAYATTKGSTREVAQAVSASLHQQGLTTETRPAREVGDMTPYDASCSAARSTWAVGTQTRVSS
jgi:menaquinone-dependent protoporphyrinogen oxidase